MSGGRFLAVTVSFGATMNVLKFILVGVGNRGRWAVRRAMESPSIEIVAIVDRSREFLEEAGKVTGLPESAWYEDLEAALQHVDCDAIIICTPTVTHRPFSELGFRYGRHVLVEKAMTHDYAEAEALVCKAEEAGVRFCVAQNYSFMRHNEKVKAILDDPGHPYHPGRIALVDIYCYRFRPEPRTMTYPWAMVWDMACHHSDMLTYWFGKPVDITQGRSFNPEWSSYPYHSNITANIRIGDGIVGNYLLYHSSTLAETRILIQGERGVLEVDNHREVLFYPRPKAQFQGAQPVKVELDEAITLDGSQEVLKSFCSYINGGEEPRISGRRNLAVLAMCRDLIAKAKDDPAFTGEAFAVEEKPVEVAGDLVKV